MRRLLAAAALAVLCTTAAACGDSSDSADSPPPPPPGLGSPAAPPAQTDNTTQVCTDARTVMTDSTVKFTQELSKAVSAAATGGDASAASVNAVKGMFTEWADGLRAEAEKATNDELKAALTDTADQIGKVADSIKSLDDLQQADKLLDTPEMGEAEKKIEAICG